MAVLIIKIDDGLNAEQCVYDGEVWLDEIDGDLETISVMQMNQITVLLPQTTMITISFGGRRNPN